MINKALFWIQFVNWSLDTLHAHKACNVSHKKSIFMIFGFWVGHVPNYYIISAQSVTQQKINLQ